MVDRALDAGVNFFDTADAYADGQSEIMLGTSNCFKSDVTRSIISIKGRQKRRREIHASQSAPAEYLTSYHLRAKVGMRMGAGLIQTGSLPQASHGLLRSKLKRLRSDVTLTAVPGRRTASTTIKESLEALIDLVRSGIVTLYRILGELA